MSVTRPLDDDPVVFATWIADSYPPGWLDQFADELDRRRGAGDLRRVLEVWSLSQGDAARLFGVSRQAVAKWMRAGVPAVRASAVADLAAAADLLVHYLRRDRIPAVVRRPSPALDDLSLIQIAARDTAAALEATRQMFDFTRLHA
jgi:DNA-binding transcriptional regulator YdaS (Cro superfamily)